MQNPAAIDLFLNSVQLLSLGFGEGNKRKRYCSIIDSFHEIDPGGIVGPESHLIVITGTGKGGFQPNTRHEQGSGCGVILRFSGLLNKAVDRAVYQGSGPYMERRNIVDQTAKALDVDFLLHAIKPVSAVWI